MRSLKKLFGPLSDLTYVTWSMVRLVLPVIPVKLAALHVLVVAAAVLPYLQWNQFGNLVDAISARQSTGAAGQQAVLFLAVVAAVAVIDRLVKKLIYDMDEHFKECFATYFPEQRISCGMSSFQRGSRTFEMLSRAERAEYSARFFVVGMMTLLRALLSAVVGAAVVASQAPIAGLILAAAVVVFLAVEVRCVTRQKLLERKHWPLLAESTSIKGGFQRKELMKAYLAFGIAHQLVEHLRVLAQRMFGPHRQENWRLLPSELLAVVALIGAYGVCGWLILEQTLAGVLSTGEFTFLVTTVLSLGLTLKLIVDTVGQQALGTDKLVDLFRYLSSSAASASALGGDEAFPEDAQVGISATEFSFTYPGSDRPVLQDLSFEIAPGETVYVLGNNGAGKTTLFNALTMFYPVERNSLYVAGADLSTLRQEDVRRAIRHLPQAPLPMRFTIRQALAFAGGFGEAAEQCPESLMWQALELATLDEKVRCFKRGLDETLAVWNDAEEDLSGGQERKLNIAMFFIAVLVGGAKVLILDEPFNAIDPVSSKKIFKNLKRLGTTLLISTHSVSDIPPGARVLFLARSGESSSGAKTQVFQGTHDELRTACEAYREYLALTVPDDPI